MSGPSELDAIRARYARRASLPDDRYSRFNPEVLARVHERQRATTALLSAHGIHSLDGLDVMFLFYSFKKPYSYTFGSIFLANSFRLLRKSEISNEYCSSLLLLFIFPAALRP